MTSLIFFAVAGSVLAWLLLSRIGRSRAWTATVPPLASIIGSGFLVSAPLIARPLGSYAVFGMAALLLLAWGFGAAVRHNIAHVEGRDDLSAVTRGLEWISDVALAFAYLVSVAYYLVLLGGFATRIAFGAPDRVLAPWIATALIATIAMLGWTGGLGRVIRVEATVVALKLAIIAGFLAALAGHAVVTGASGGPLAPLPGRVSAEAVPTLLGLLIVVQGFETSRYLGEEFDAETRIRTMKQAQIIAAIIYVFFFVLILPVLPSMLDAGGETAIIDTAAVVGLALPLMLTIGAVASQFSAAVADSLGGAGLISEVAGKRLHSNHAFALIGAAAITVVWSTDIFGVIALASRAFALYYMLQCLVAAANCIGRGRRAQADPRVGMIRAVGFWIMALVGAAVLIFGVPAE